MGVNLGELVEPEEISFAELNDTVIAVDAMNTLYQFLSIIRQPDGTPLKDSQGRTTSHLSGLFYRSVKLFEHNIKPVYIFDGDAPDLKATEQAERRKKREEARKEWKRLKSEGKTEEAYTKATQSSKLAGDDIERAQRLLDAMGVPYIIAPSEGEAQGAYMDRDGAVDAVGSQDWDALLFGCDTMVRNLTSTGKRKIPGKQQYREVVPERIRRERVLDELGLTQEQLIWLAVLVGTDFNPGGVHGIGPKRGLDLVRECDSFDAVLEDDKVDWEHDADPEAVIDFFQHPPIETDASFSFSAPDEDAIRGLLVDDHSFSADRISSTLETYLDARQERQAGLGSFVG